MFEDFTIRARTWEISGVARIQYPARRANVGEKVGKKWRKVSGSILLAAAIACLFFSGCGGGGTTNRIVVTVTSDRGTVLVPTQVATITAIVTGATDVSSSFDCSFTTTPNPTTATPNPKPSASQECTTANGAVGALSNILNTSTTAASTATFTAPATFPDQTKFPNVIVTITATANADKKTKGTFNIIFDSGIRIRITPATATVSTSASFQFLAVDLNNNSIPNDQLTWGVTFETIATINSKSCSGGTNDCGSIATNAASAEIYTAPNAVPKASTATSPAQNAAGIVTVFAFSKVDSARIAQAAVTIVKAGNITFSGLSPSLAPQGGLQQDIILAATNATSQMGVTLTGPCSNGTSNGTLDQSQIKVIFPAGTATSASGARIRLNSAQLVNAGHCMVQVTTSNPSVTVTGGPFPLDVVPVRPTIVSSTPDDLQESKLNQTGGTPITVNGGFFGTNSSPVVTAPLFNNTTVLNPVSVASARQMTGFLPAPSGSGPNAGLFPLSFKYSTSPGPFTPPAAPTAFTNIAVIPDYGGANAATKTATPVSLPASSAASAIALDPLLGYAVVTLAGVNTPSSTSPTVNSGNHVQLINLAGGSPTPAGLFSSQGFLATGVAVDDSLHIAAVVNYASRSLSILSIPAGTLLGTVDMSGLIPPPAIQTNPPFVEPFPYSVGIDPFSHRALVAFASTNVGLIVNLDPGATPTCLPIGASTAPYCAIAFVTLNSGATPQVAFEAQAHLAYATPGGSGVISAVDLANPSTGSVGITSATRASNVVTVTTSAPHNLNAGNPGTVLISGLPKGTTNGTNFDGAFSVGAVLDSTHFQYSQADKDDTSTCTATCLASSGVPFLTYTFSPSIVGIAVNPVTRTVVVADPNATVTQVSFIDAQSESVTGLTLFGGVTGPASTGSPELGATMVAFQPFTNTAVSFNPRRNEISMLDPAILQRLQIIQTGQSATATASFTPSGSTTAISVNLSGALAVDSVDNLALAVNSGSDNISLIKLGNIKSVHIERVLTPAIDAPTFSVPAKIAQAVKITLGGTPAATGSVKIFGSGFSTPLQVRLDGVDITTFTPAATVTPVDNHEVDVTFPAGFFTAPRHFALDVVNSLGVGSNVMDLAVIEEIPLPACSGTAAAPGGVAIDEVNNLAVVTNTGCNQVTIFSLDPAKIFNQTLNTIPTGAAPTAVAVLPKLTYTGQANGSGVAVVTNNSANTVSILDLVNLKAVPGVTDVAVGTGPTGLAIDQETNLAVIANTKSNTVSTLDLTPLTASPIGKLTPVSVAVDQQPMAVAIDPDRGTNGRGLAVVTGVQLNGAAPASGSLDSVDIGATTPVKQLTGLVGSVQATPTGIVFDPSVSPALFYAVSTQANQITSYNPDTGTALPIKVGINPNAIAFNFQTGTLLTVNSLSNSISVVDSQTFRTKATLGIGGTSTFAAAIQTFTNLAVIVDQANNRVLIFQLPK